VLRRSQLRGRIRAPRPEVPGSCPGAVRFERISDEFKFQHFERFLIFECFSFEMGGWCEGEAANARGESRLELEVLRREPVPPPLPQPLEHPLLTCRVCDFRDFEIVSPVPAALTSRNFRNSLSLAL